jgi:inorganic triphosphatase YgiF
MLTAADIEAEYVDVFATISPRQLWAIELYGTARALVALDRGSLLAGTPDEQKAARELLFEGEADRRNREVRGVNAGRANLSLLHKRR